MNDYERVKFFATWSIIISSCLLFWLFIYAIACNVAKADTINMYKIAEIESSHNPLAWNKKDNSRGLYQITPICLTEYNNYHPNATYIMDDLWNTAINTIVAEWYLNVRIPQMLRHYKKPVTIKNIIISYNAGISYVAFNKKLPKTTEDYLKKYFNK